MLSLIIFAATASAAAIRSVKPHYYLPQFDPNPTARAAEIASNRAGFTYGPSLLGNLSFFPGGTLGEQLVQNDLVIFAQKESYVTNLTTVEAFDAGVTVITEGGLENLSDYAELYNMQWPNSDASGPMPGSLTNYTQDLYFSMDRLSTNAYKVKRLNPEQDTLPFGIDNSIVKQLTTMTLGKLFRKGRLFVVDHSDQANATIAKYLQEGKYAAACTAYFYISVSGDFLPLAIKTNVGSDLIYTPLDSPEDWLLAKILFNNNDFFHGQVWHLSATHAVSEIVYLAGLRTLASAHPVRAFMQRIMFTAFAIRPFGTEHLFNPGGPFDNVLGISSVGALIWAETHYSSDAGKFKSNYLKTQLTNRGLIDSPYGPPLKYFPFYNDASALVNTINCFVTKYVLSYYRTAESIIADKELQAWVKEANGPAQVLDFPSAITSQETLIEVLTHLSYLGAITHNALNHNTGFSALGVLPLHPAALYNPIPTAKGITDVLPFLPNVTQSVSQIALLTAFNRPAAKNSGDDLINMFSVANFTDGSNQVVASAVAEFKTTMRFLSRVIGERTFGTDGLSEGAPFVWKLLDPKVVPYYLSV